MIAAVAAVPPGNTRHRTAVGSDVDSRTTTSERERQRAFQQHVVPELELLYAMAMRLTRDPHAAEDLVQDTVLRAYRAIDRFDGRHPRAWLLTILRNTNINRGRRRTPSLLLDPDRTLGQVAAAGADGRDGAAEPALDRIADPALVRALRSLSEDHQAVVALVDVDGLTYAEAAELLDVPIGTVMSRLHRARRRLKTRLERDGAFEEMRR